MTGSPKSSIGLIGEMAGTTSQKIVISGDQSQEEIAGRMDKSINYNIRSSMECFVVDIDYLSLLGKERDTTISSSSNSSTNIHHHLQRSLSRKGSTSHQRGGKATQQTQTESTAAAGVGGGNVVGAMDHHHHESSNKGTSLMMGTSNKQPSIIVVGGVVGATIGTENINIGNTKTVKETVTVVKAESSKWRRYNNSINQRCSSSSSFSSWMMDPRRILLFFATLSSMGTIILIYFTLSMTKLDGEDMATVSHTQ